MYQSKRQKNLKLFTHFNIINKHFPLNNLPKIFLPFAEEKEFLNGNNGNGSSASSHDFSEDEDPPVECTGGGVILVRNCFYFE